MKRIQLPFGPLHKSTFLERPNRFLLRCILDGEAVEAHLPDPGRLKELLLPGAPVWLSRSTNPKRRTKWSAVLTQDPESRALVSIQSTLVNALVRKALAEEALEEFAGWSLERTEYAYASSRWDFLLTRPDGKKLLLEAKSVTLVEGKTALFPDAVTARGRRHVLELAALQQEGRFETAVLFVVQRHDALCFAPAEHIDPAFTSALQSAYKEGVKVHARACHVTQERIVLGGQLPVCLTEGEEHDT